MKTKIVKHEPTVFGVQIKELRESQGLTQKQFAEAIGASQGTVCNWERFRVRKLSPYWIGIINDLFGVKIKVK